MVYIDKKGALSFVLGILLIILLVGCNFNSEKKEENLYATPEDTIHQLEKGINDYDMDEIADCFNKDIKKILSGGGKVLGSLTGIDMGGVFELITGLSGITEAEFEDVTCKLSVEDINYEDEENCRVYVNGTASAGGETESGEMEVKMELEKNEWKIKITMDDLEAAGII